MQNTVVAVAVEAACAVAYINLAFYLAYRRPVNHAETLAFTIFRFRVNWLAMASNSPQTWYLPGMRSRLLALFWLYACRSLYRAELMMQTSIFFKSGSCCGRVFLGMIGLVEAQCSIVSILTPWRNHTRPLEIEFKWSPKLTTTSTTFHPQRIKSLIWPKLNCLGCIVVQNWPWYRFTRQSVHDKTTKSNKSPEKNWNVAMGSDTNKTRYFGNLWSLAISTFRVSHSYKCHSLSLTPSAYRLNCRKQISNFVCQYEKSHKQHRYNSTGCHSLFFSQIISSPSMLNRGLAAQCKKSRHRTITKAKNVLFEFLLRSPSTLTCKYYV